MLCLADFLGSKITFAVTQPGRALCTVGLQLGRWICLPSSAPKPFNVLFRQHAEVSRLRLHVATWDSNGILTVSAIGLDVRLILRTRLTPG